MVRRLASYRSAFAVLQTPKRGRAVAYTVFAFLSFFLFFYWTTMHEIASFIT
jgi:hypothetical protein